MLVTISPLVLATLLAAATLALPASSYANDVAVGVETNVTISSASAVQSEWTRSDIGKLRRLSIRERMQSPPSPGNRVADSAEAAALGEAIFFDTRFSGDQQQSCASCHNPAQDFTDGHAIATGTRLTLRNAPGLIGTAHYKWWYWDGRADSLWSQALIPFEAPDEMASSRVAVLKAFSLMPERVAQYETLFGPMPSSEFIDALPEQAGPLGDLASRSAWYRLDEASRKSINVFYANIGKSIAAFQRTLNFEPSRFDRFAQQVIDSSSTADVTTVNSAEYSEQEIHGLRLYLDDSKTHCRNCHNGTLFSNSEFYDVGSAALAGTRADHGRSLGLVAARRSEFNCLGEYSDVAAADKYRLCRLAKIHDDSSNVLAIGAFKTPTLRRIKHTAPYFHDGSMETLEDVIRHYQHLDMSARSIQRQVTKTIAKAKAEHQLPPMNLSESEIAALIAFLETL